MAIAAVSGFNALLRHAKTRLTRTANGTTSFPMITVCDKLCLLDLCAYVLATYFEEASVTCGFVDLECGPARPPKRRHTSRHSQRARVVHAAGEVWGGATPTHPGSSAAVHRHPRGRW